jgi:NDP-sugar pyrophosphorylase family protein
MKLSRGDVSLVLLAGGYNTRMRRTERSLPKSLLPLPGLPPMMVMLADQFLADGASVVITCDALGVEKLGLLYPWLAKSARVVQDEFAGTGQALRKGVEAARTHWVLVANADTIVPVDLTAWYRSVDLVAPVHQLLTPHSVQNSGLIGVDPYDRSVRHWGETGSGTPPSPLCHASSTGVYLLNRNTWRGWEGSGADSLEREILPEAVSQRLVHGTIAPSPLPVFDFGTVSRFQELEDDDRLRRSLLAAARLTPKGHWCTPPSFSSEPTDISNARRSLAASAARN